MKLRRLLQSINCFTYKDNQIFITLTIIIYIICSYYSWIIITGENYRKIVPVIPFVGQYLESILNACAMLSLALFEFGQNRKQVTKTFQEIDIVDKKLESIGIIVDTRPSKKFLYISNITNILLTLIVLVVLIVIQHFAFGFGSWIFTTHNILPTLLTTSIILLYGYILHCITRRIYIINYNLGVINKNRCDSERNQNLKYNLTRNWNYNIRNRVHNLLLIHGDLCDIMESSNEAFALILLLFSIYLLVVILFRLYTSIQIFWDVLTKYDQGPLMLGVATLGRQILVHPIIGVLVYLSEHLKKQVCTNDKNIYKIL